MVRTNSGAAQREADLLFEIDTGHDLMITEPEAVTEMLLQVAAADRSTQRQPA